MRSLIVLLSVLSLWLGGCAKKQIDVADVSRGAVPGAPAGQFDDGLSGGIAEFVPTGSGSSEQKKAMEDYVYERPLNNPSEFRIRLSLKQDGTSGLYKGYVNISYYDDGVFYQSNQETGDETVDVKYSRFDGHKEYKYNKWITSGSDTQFRAVFQDAYGAVVIVIDEVTDLGDGLGLADYANGKIYYKNFGHPYSGSSPTKCWFVTLGPYQCSPDFEGNSIYPRTSSYGGGGSEGYKLLGEFKNLNLRHAFNLD